MWLDKSLSADDDRKRRLFSPDYLLGNPQAQAYDSLTISLRQGRVRFEVRAVAASFALQGTAPF